MKHIKNLKKILTLAVQKELISTNPFQFYRCSYQTTARERLTEEELKKLMNTKFKRVALEEARDCYVAMCFTGYAYTDAFLLAPENIQVLDDGGRWFVKNREKTSGNENVPILPVVEQIIEKYKDHPYCLAYNKVFPIHSNQKFNSYLKDITKVAGINKELTTHTARHTFATTVTLSNGMPIETVSKLLGHSSIKTTQIYAKVVEKKVSEDMKTLNKKWSNKLI
jgi:site-specific recombinase XerD